MKDLPEKFSLDDLFDRIVLMEKIEVGLKQSKTKQTHSTEQAKEKLKNKKNA